MIPRIIHFTVPRNLTEQQVVSIQRARDLHPGWEVSVWQDPVNNAGFLLAPYHDKANSGAQLADLIRLDIIYAYGGIYLDSDVYLHKPLDPVLVHRNIFCSEDGINLTNAVFAATPRHPIVRRLIDELLSNEPDWTRPPNQTTGPCLFARVLRWEPSLELLPRDAFYPYNYNEQPIDPLPTSYGSHQWAASWVPENLKHTKPAALPRRSLRQTIKDHVKRLVKPFEDRFAAAVVEQSRSGERSYTFGQDLIAMTSRNLLMSLPGADLSVTPEIALRGTYEEPELQFLESVLKGGDFFVDVGCNVGIFSLVAARRVGPFGRVFAIDANPAVLEHLKRSLVMNWVHDRTVIFNHAVGAEDKEMSLQFSELCLGGASLGLDDESVFHRSTALLGAMRSIPVRQIRLDDLFPSLPEVKVLKIDVEGFEYGVLAGAERLARNQCFQYVLMELLEEVSSTRHRLNVHAVEQMQTFGYRVCNVNLSGELVEADNLAKAIERSRNIVLARKSPIQLCG